jgi:hypothetical protein
LSRAAGWSVVLTFLAFVIHIPLRAGAHNLIQTASGGSVEVKALPQTYFQAYGVPELVLTGSGIVVAAIVACLLWHRARHHEPTAGGVAWGISIASLAVGIVGLVTVAPYLFLVGIFLLVSCHNFARQTARMVRSEPSPQPATLGTVG